MKPQVGLKKNKTAKSSARLTKEKNTQITIIGNKRGLYYTSYQKFF